MTTEKKHAKMEVWNWGNINIDGKTVHSIYLGPALTNRGMRKIVNRMVTKLKPLIGQFDAIAFTGVSGALIAPAVALMLSKDLIVVRKKESQHSTLLVEGVQANRYIIIDDFVSGGNTISEIKNNIDKAGIGSQLVGIVLYNTNCVVLQLREFSAKYGVWVLHNQSTKPLYYTPKKPEI